MTTRDTRFADALDDIRRWQSPGAALTSAGIDPDALTADEWRQVADAEQAAVDEAIEQIRKAAQTDPSAARWLRERGIDP